MRIEGKIALVTGAAHRLGKVIALALAKSGCDLLVHYKESGEAARETVGEASSMGISAVAVQADLSKREGVLEAFRQADEAYGGIDLLVNSAAILDQVDLLDVNEEHWRQIIGLNLKGAFFVLQEAARRMAGRGGGAVVNVSDTAGHRPWKRYPLHSIGKAGLEMLTEVAAYSLAPTIRVNSVVPGPTLKPPWMGSERWNEVTGRIPLEGAIPGTEVAEAVIFLFENDYITGHSLRVDGGSLLI